MRSFLAVLLEIFSVIGFIAVIVVSAMNGGLIREFINPLFGLQITANGIVDLAIGGVFGFIVAVFAFGLIFVLLDIRVSTRRSAAQLQELIDRRRAQAQMARPSRPPGM